ncbi:PREDICTED: receptor-like serine/threonine-protein kinase SD1-8 [Tarenaya hassleriana]|uniref:receptor-like serine/threonine-protein kinase SD1-8 n=1 Tax=Tarenaya hassleriana TaxID=28532 RepID=UPI00053C40D5|nr:PREDICTED: receptor-like serine/threonine-protein kinase SD1-8 [Tarenaya hassleriana]
MLCDVVSERQKQMLHKLEFTCVRGKYIPCALRDFGGENQVQSPPKPNIIHRVTFFFNLTVSENRTLVSPGGVFELGFFKPSDSRNSWYLGIWYKTIPKRTYVWVANRDNPLSNSSGTLKISDRNLALFDQADNPVWSTNLTGEVKSPVAELLDNGNFVFRDSENNNPDEFLWQSFDHPTDTLLPEMKLGWDLRTGFDRYITSWRSPDDPSTGDFLFKLESRGFPEIFLWNRDSRVYRSGPWHGVRFSGVPEMHYSRLQIQPFR